MQCHFAIMKINFDLGTEICHLWDLEPHCKMSYDNLTIILKVVVHQVQTVNLNSNLEFCKEPTPQHLMYKNHKMLSIMMPLDQMSEKRQSHFAIMKIHFDLVTEICHLRDLESHCKMS